MSELPLPPEATWSWRRRTEAMRRFHVGSELMRDEVGRVGMLRLAPACLGRLGQPYVMVSSARGARDVLAGFDGSIDKYGAFHEEFRRISPPNVFTMAHQEWLPRRRALQPAFTKAEVATYVSSMGQVAGEHASAWASAGTIDVAARTRRLTFDVLGRSLFGLQLGHRADGLAAASEATGHYAMRRAQAPIRAPLWMQTPQRRSYDKAMGALDAISDEAIALAQRDPDHEAPLIRQLLASAEPLTTPQIRGDLQAFLFAGHDTTATALAYALWQVGRDPVLQESMADEALGVGTGPLSAEDVPRLELTLRVLHEAMRLCPPAAAVARMTRREVEIDGFRIPAEWNLIVSIYALHRDPVAWERALAFEPDRFLPEQARGRDRWQYLPFGGGPRSCIGDHFAMLEATVALATLVRDLEITSLAADFPLTVEFTLKAGGETPIQVRRRTR